MQSGKKRPRDGASQQSQQPLRKQPSVPVAQTASKDVGDFLKSLESMFDPDAEAGTSVPASTAPGASVGTVESNAQHANTTVQAQHTQLDALSSNAVRIPSKNDLPRLLIDMFPGMEKTSLLANRVSRPLPLDVTMLGVSSTFMGVSTSSRRRKRAHHTDEARRRVAKAYLDSTHGLKVDKSFGDRPKPSALETEKLTSAPLGLGKAIDVHAANANLQKRDMFKIPPDILTQLHGQWMTYAHAFLQAASNLTGTAGSASAGGYQGRTESKEGLVALETLRNDATAGRRLKMKPKATPPLEICTSRDKLMKLSSHLARPFSWLFAFVTVPHLVDVRGYVVFEGATSWRILVDASTGSVVNVPLVGTWFSVMWPASATAAPTITAEESTLLLEICGDKFAVEPVGRRVLRSMYSKS